mgnify:CR=1 FL=1
MDSKKLGQVPKWVYIGLAIIAILVFYFVFFKREKQEPELTDEPILTHNENQATQKNNSQEA